MDFNLDSLNNPYIALWVAMAAGLIKLFQKELAAFIPTAIREHFAARDARIKDLQEHRQEIEEVSVEARLQSDVTAQLQLIQVNKRLVDFLTGQIDQRLNDIERILRDIRDISRDGQAQSKIVQVEWSRIVDILTRTEKLLTGLEAGFKSGQSEVKGDV